jgi:hypothetical protein
MAAATKSSTSPELICSGEFLSMQIRSGSVFAENNAEQ